MSARPLSLRAFLAKPVTLFLAFLVVLTGVRCAFFLTFGSGSFSWSDFAPALLMGLRLDAKWLATLTLPAWILWIAGGALPRLRMPAAVLGVLGEGPHGHPRARQP